MNCFFFFLGYSVTLENKLLIFCLRGYTCLPLFLGLSRRMEWDLTFLNCRISLNPYVYSGTSFWFSAQPRPPASAAVFSQRISLASNGWERDCYLAIWGRGEGFRYLPALKTELEQNLFTEPTSFSLPELLVVSNSQDLLKFHGKNQPIFHHRGTLFTQLGHLQLVHLLLIFQKFVDIFSPSYYHPFSLSFVVYILFYLLRWCFRRKQKQNIYLIYIV